MNRESKKNQKWPGLTEAAATLGVSYQHCRLVLKGERRGNRLLARLAPMINTTPNKSDKTS